MDPTTTKLINEALAGLINSVTAVKDFAVVQVPELLRQLLMVDLLVVVSLSSAIAAFAFFMWRTRKAYKKKGIDLTDPEYTWYSVTLCIGASISVIAFVPIYIHLLEVLKIILAPKLFLLEYAAHLIR